MISCAVASGGTAPVSSARQLLLGTGTMFQRARKLFNNSTEAIFFRSTRSALLTRRAASSSEQ